jgi:hypothetical protein
MLQVSPRLVASAHKVFKSGDQKLTRCPQRKDFDFKSSRTPCAGKVRELAKAEAGQVRQASRSLPC